METGYRELVGKRFKAALALELYERIKTRHVDTIITNTITLWLAWLSLARLQLEKSSLRILVIFKRLFVDLIIRRDCISLSHQNFSAILTYCHTRCRYLLRFEDM